MDAFDADVLIYAAEPGNPLGGPVRDLFAAAGDAPDARPAGFGSVLLLPELLAKPRRDHNDAEAAALVSLLDRIELVAVGHETAKLAVVLGSKYGLRALDATHLATAILGGADRFITNNSKDFSDAITEIAIVGPSELT